MTTFNRILYATDFSPHAEAAGDIALQLGRHPGTEVWAINVIEPVPMPLVAEDEPAMVPAAVWDAEFSAIEHGTNADMRDRLHEALVGFRDAGIPVHEVVVTGDVARTVAGEAGNIDADLIVIGKHGHRTISDLLLGSTAAKIFKRAPCPVLAMCACEDTHSPSEA